MTLYGSDAADEQIEAEAIVTKGRNSKNAEVREICLLYFSERKREELPNPRDLAELHIGDVIDLENMEVVAVAQALVEKGIERVGDLLDKGHVGRVVLFGDLNVELHQIESFIKDIEHAGVRI